MYFTFLAFDDPFPFPTPQTPPIETLVWAAGTREAIAIEFEDRELHLKTYVCSLTANVFHISRI